MAGGRAKTKSCLPSRAFPVTWRSPQPARTQGVAQAEWDDAFCRLQKAIIELDTHPGVWLVATTWLHIYSKTFISNHGAQNNLSAMQELQHHILCRNNIVWIIS